MNLIVFIFLKFMSKKKNFDGQLSIFDVSPLEIQPELWECMETCKNFGKRTGYFPTGEKRCELPFSYGNPGLIQEIDDESIVHFHCKFYEFKG